jgi:hypothetical protein
MYVRLVAALFLIAGFVAARPASAAGDQNALCTVSESTYFDDLSGIWSPCATAPGKVVVEATYLQNASVVGGTTFADYPSLTLRTGIVKNLGFIFTSPSQVAETAPHGVQIYPQTHLGYGLSYTASETTSDAVSIFGQVLPPVNVFSPTHVQSRYLLGVSDDYALTQKISLGFFGTGTSSESAGLDRIYPSEALKAAYNLSSLTQFETDFGTRSTARHGQSFGDVAVTQMLHKHFDLKIGLGTTFNPVSNSKAHYIASGLGYAL